MSAEAGSRRSKRGGGRPLIQSDAFEALAPEWASLHRSLPAATPFTHPAWAETWLREEGATALPVFLSVRRDDILIGVIPLDMASGEARLLGDPGVTDYAPLLAAPGEEEAVASALLEWLREDLTTGALLWGVPAESPFAAAIRASGGSMGWSVEEAEEAVAPARDLPPTWEEYLSRLGKKDRHELRRKMRNFEAAGAASFQEVTSGERFAAALETLIALMRASHPGKVEFLARHEPFFRAIALAMAGAGLGRLSTLVLDGEPTGMTLAFENPETVYLYNSGYDPSFARISAGLVSKAWVIRSAIECGKQTFDFLRGHEDYKHNLGGEPRPILSFTLRQQ
jgi:CelD/BcsL family acetyltransferase involved in cellulose biosynthesis